jgi:hypothetical protein
VADRRPRHNAVLASAVRVTAEVAQTLPTDNQPWQRDAWRFYDAVGELHSGMTWQSNAASRARLLAAHPAEKPGDEPTPIESGPAFDLMEQLAGGTGGQSELLSDFVVNLGVPGDCYLVGFESNDLDLAPDRNGRVWQVRSIDDTRVRRNGNIELQLDDSGKYVRLGPESLAVRVWRPHKRHKWLADSPVKSALSTLTELELLNRHIVATARSRLAGAGILLVPNEITLPQQAQRASNQEPFLVELMETMLTAIKDPGSASAVVPIVAKVPAEFLEKVKHIAFSTPFDEHVLELRDSAIRRLATALDMPAEALLGVGDVNHWTAWQIGEEGLTLHLDPVLEVICRALTIGYLRPMLEAAGADTDAVVWYDTTELQTRPDRTETSIALLDRFIIDPEAAIREAGLEEADVPNDETIRKMAGLTALRSPETWEQGLALLGIESTAQPATVNTLPAPVEPEQPEPPVVGPPEPEPEPMAASGYEHLEGLVEACDGIMVRAFERAGNRLRSWAVKEQQNGQLDLSTCPPHEVHCRVMPFQYRQASKLFDDAWDRVPEIAQRYGVDERCLQETLTAYAWGLIGRQAGYRRDKLAMELQVGCCWEPAGVA